MHDIHDQLAQFNNADDSLELLKSNLKTIKMINRSSSVMTIICTECSIRVYITMIASRSFSYKFKKLKVIQPCWTVSLGSGPA